MTTIPSTASTPSASPASTSSVTSAAATSLLNSLEVGSGVDTASLVTSLVTAQYAAKTSALTARFDALSAKLSGVTTLKSTITTFSTALDTLTKGGTLATQPTSSNGAVLSATAIPGAKLAGLSASITVEQLAGAQTAVSMLPKASATAPVGTGTLTLTFGTATYADDGSMASFAAGGGNSLAIDITAADDSLTGVAAAINAKKAGLTASVVVDADGSAYLSLKSTSGATRAFTLTATTDTDGTLSDLNVGVGATGTTISSQGKNAKLTIDGVRVERATNIISDLVTGVKLQLNAVSTAPVALTGTTPTSALSQAITDFVDTYNEVMKIVGEQTDPITGALRADSAAAAMQRALKGLTLAPLTGTDGTGAPTTLAQIGVATNRDGTLRVDTATLLRTLIAAPEAIEAMFAPTQPNATTAVGLAATLKAIATQAIAAGTGLGAATVRYTAAQTEIAEDRDDLSLQSEATKTRLTQQFASMNSRVAAYKSTQAFLTQQIDAWNNSNN